MHDPGAACFGQELGAETDQAPGRDDELDPVAISALAGHRLHPPLAAGKQLSHCAHVLLRDIDQQTLGRLQHLPVLFAGHHLRLSGSQLEPLAAHQLEQHDQLQLSTPLHLPGIGAFGWQDSDRDISEQLLIEPCLDLTRRQLVAFATCERRGVYPHLDRKGRLIYLDHRQG